MTIHVFFPYEGLQPGTRWAQWWYRDGNLFDSREEGWALGQRGLYYEILEAEKGLLPGEYQLILAIEGRVVQRGTCAIEEPTATKTPSPTPTRTPRPTRPPTPPPRTGIRQGVNVRVVKTGGERLRIREKPSTDAKILLRVEEGTILEVVDGPVTADGYTWWKVKRGSTVGWTARNWLEPAK